MKLLINKKIILEENRYVNSAIGLGLGAAAGAGLSHLGYEHEINNLNDSNKQMLAHTNDELNGASIKAQFNNQGIEVQAPNADHPHKVNVSFDIGKVKDMKDVLPNIDITDRNSGNKIDLINRAKTYFGNEGLKKSLTDHHDGLIGTGAALGGLTGLNLAYGLSNKSTKENKQ